MREILGEEWLDLPFDREGMLRAWTIHSGLPGNEKLTELYEVYGTI